MKRLLLGLVSILLYSISSYSQNDSIQQSLTFTGDFKFRIEQDWKSKKSDDTYRDDRSRLRYRARFGVNYQLNNSSSFGLRLRTGFSQKQQDPQLTLGDGFSEFGTIPITLEKLFFQYSKNNFLSWVGKNTFPFKKQNELFWSDHIYPEGIFVSKLFKINSKSIQSFKLNAGHFIIKTNGNEFSDDSYFQGIQIQTTHLNKTLELFPSFYYFNKVPNIPDGNETYFQKYAIIHLGTKLKISNQPKITAGFDYYENLTDYSNNDSIQNVFKNQKTGAVATFIIGDDSEKGDWLFGLTLNYQEKFAAIDFFSQNDWVRWDYSSQGSPDGRLTNYKGFDFMVGYAIANNIKLNMRFFMVEQLVPLGIAKENGNRVRFDLDVKF